MKKVFSVVLILVCPILLSGQSIFSNNIATNNPNNDNPYIIGQLVDANLTVSGIGRGPAINGNNGNSRYNARDWNLTALDAGDYFYFTLTPNFGYEIDFTSFIFNVERSNTGPVQITVRSSLDGYTNDIGSPTIGGSGVITQSTVDLSGVNYQNINSAITFRVYAWGGTNTNGTLSINDFIFNGAVNVIQCPLTTTWDGINWSVTPSSSTAAIINGDLNTSTDGSFSACSLTINSGTLIIGNGDYVEVENDVFVANAGGINVSSQGAFVQKNENSTFTNNSSNGVTLTKTKVMQNWYHYTYWSSPMVAESLENVLGVTPLDRRFRYEASNFVDLLSEIDNTGTFNPGPDDIDDNGDDWQLMPSGNMIPGIGYATTASTIVGPGGYPNAQSFVFTGSFNNGTINVPLVNSSGGVYNDWNFIGNPYPGAISVDDFFAVNTGLVDVIYLWDQATPPSPTASGNEGSNFSSDDYAIINGMGQIGARGDTGIEPERYIASGQGFFVEALSAGSVAFTNAMRVTGNNTQFFKSSNAKKTTINNSVDNKIWLNCSSDNGFSNQILIGYNETATKGVDATFYDVPRSLRHSSMMLYSQIEKSNKAFVIQGKNAKDLTHNEKIKLGFSTAIGIPTMYKLSIDKLQGEFLIHNTVYLKDRLLKKTHDLSNSDYTFTSEVGEFNDRFEISFKGNSSFNNGVSENKITVVERNNDNVVFSTTGDFNIDLISIYDFSGNLIYKLEGNSSQETFELSKLKKSLYIAKVELSSGDIITKKFIKK